MSRPAESAAWKSAASFFRISSEDPSSACGTLGEASRGGTGRGLRVTGRLSLQEETTGGFCCGTWRKPSTVWPSRSSWRASTCPTSSAWPSTAPTPKSSPAVSAADPEALRLYFSVWERDSRSRRCRFWSECCWVGLLLCVPTGNDEQVILHDVERWVTLSAGSAAAAAAAAASFTWECLSLQEGDPERLPAHRRRLQPVRQPRQRQRLRQLVWRRQSSHLGHSRAATWRWVSEKNPPRFRCFLFVWKKVKPSSRPCRALLPG